MDFDLAVLYQTETRALKQAVRRNINRFPEDFMFEVTKREFKILRSQFVISKLGSGGSRYLPFAFTEQGVARLSSVVNTKKTIQVNIAIMRAFVFIRQYALSHRDLTEKLKELETKYSKQFKDVYEAINYLLQKDKLEVAQRKRKKIGFRQNEEA
ncbi:MAG TPA: ORF6N domain-containing protein [Saprospiraceae bacterium]|nr:ORF6N domain-containing protein [Saprospiraceae bacterium]